MCRKKIVSYIHSHRSVCSLNYVKCCSVKRQKKYGPSTTLSTFFHQFQDSVFLRIFCKFNFLIFYNSNTHITVISSIHFNFSVNTHHNKLSQYNKWQEWKYEAKSFHLNKIRAIKSVQKSVCPFYGTFQRMMFSNSTSCAIPLRVPMQLVGQWKKVKWSLSNNKSSSQFKWTTQMICKRAQNKKPTTNNKEYR